VLTPDGGLVMQGEEDFPCFITMMSPSTKAFLKECPKEDMRPGDVYICNDPYRGGTHKPDVRMLRPVFWEDEIVAFVSNSGHWPDVGGQTPGSFPVDACDSIAEGLCIPPINIAADDAVVEDVEKLILANLRLPISSRGDIRAMISSLQTGEKRLHELYARYGKETVAAVMQEYIRYSERLLRSAIRALPEGSFTWTDFEEKARGISDPDNKIWGSETIPVGWHMYSVKQAWQNGGSYYSPDFRECWLDKEETIQAIQFWADLLLDGNVMPSPSQIVGIGGAGAAAELLAAGKIGMQRMGSWVTGSLVDAGFRFNVVAEPSQTQRDTITHGAFNNISTTSENKDTAWIWLNYNTSTQGIYNYASNANFPGTRRSSNEIEPFPWVADVDFEVDWDVVPDALTYGHILPGPANEGEALKLIGDALDKVYSGDVQAADIFPEVAPKVTAVISDV